MPLRPAVALIALLALAQTAGADTALVRLTSPDGSVGGLSGIEVLDHGRRFIALSDRGFLLEGGMLREDGKLSGIEVTSKKRLPRADGQGAEAVTVDSEGIAITPQGEILISTEQTNQIWWLAPDLSPRSVVSPPDAGRLPHNGAYEALAVAPNGDVYTVGEGVLADGSAPHLWRYDGKDWQALLRIPREDRYMPVGADFGPDGQLYILQRAVGLGLRARILRLDPEDPATPPQLIWESDRHPGTNFEGLSIWTTEAGQLMVTLVSDNNFWPLFQTVFLEKPLAPLGGSS